VINLPRDGTKNLTPINQRPIEEQKKIREKAVQKSAEKRRANKREKDSLRKLLSLMPNLEIFLQNPKNKSMFDMLGIAEKDIPNIETLTDLKLIQGALNGDLQCKKYIDERVGRNPDFELKRRSAELDERRHELNRQRMRGEYDIDLESGMIDDSGGGDEGDDGEI
jgi:hypothetical protein